MRNIQSWLSAINVFARFIVTLHANPSRTPTAIPPEKLSQFVLVSLIKQREFAQLLILLLISFSPLYIRRGYQTIYISPIYPLILLSCISFWKLILSFTILYLFNPPYYTDTIIIKTTSSEILLLLNLRLNCKDGQYLRIPLSDIVFSF